MKKKFKTTEDVKAFVEKWASAASVEIMAWSDAGLFLHCHFERNECIGTHFLYEISHGLDRCCVVCPNKDFLTLAIPTNDL